MKQGGDRKQESSTTISREKWWHAYFYFHFLTFPVVVYAHYLIHGNTSNRCAIGGLAKCTVYTVEINKIPSVTKLALQQFTYNHHKALECLQCEIWQSHPDIMIQ